MNSWTEEQLEGEIRIARMWNVQHSVYHGCSDECPVRGAIQETLRKLIALRRPTAGFGELDFEHGAPKAGPRYGSDELD